MSGDSVSSGSSDISDIYLPNKSVAAQDLVGGSYTLAGFLRKRAPINTFPGTKKIFPWGQRFVVLHRGCLYCYKNETDRKPCSSFSLFGYNKVFRAGEVLPSEAPWAFKLCHAYPTFKTYYFSAASEDNMKTWMKQMKLEMIRANKQSVNRTSADGRSDGCDDSMSYRAIEEAIYDANEFRPVSKAPQAPLEDDDSEDDYNDVTNLTMPELPEKPIVPKRPLPRPNWTLAGLGRCPHEADYLTWDITHHVDSTDRCLFKKGFRPALGAISNELQNLQIGKKTDETRGKKRLPGDGRETTPFHREPRDGGSPTMPPDEAPLPPKKPQKPRKASVTEENYWSLIYFQETRGNTASELIRRLGEEGVFLVRDSQSGSSKVLVVFAEGMPKKYKINYQAGRYSLTQEHSFESIEELIYFYHSSALPCNVCLTIPFFKHPDYNP